MRRTDATLWFWAGLLALIVVRLVLVADLSLQIVYSPHDDSMYVARAYHFLRGEGFGPYDSTIIVKYPGISLWLASVRSLGVPYLFSIQALHILAGLYMLAALRRCGVDRWIALAAFALYLLNPIGFGLEWFRVLREPLGIGFFVAMLAAALHMAKSVREGRQPWPHAALFAVLLAFSLFLREDDKLLWGLLVFVGAGLAWQAGRTRERRKGIVVALILVVGSVVLAKGYEYSLRAFYARHYGAPILHELSEGEYPRFLAAARSVRVAKDNRMVGIAQETLAKLYRKVPDLRPVIDRLPPPGPRTYSCLYHGVCTEWGNGWMAFWFRDAAFRAGLTPSLVEEQNYYRRMRLNIMSACASGALDCAPKGSGLIPPMELRWTRAYLVEGLHLVRQLLAPEPDTIVMQQQRLSGIPPEVVEQYESVAMSQAGSHRVSAGTSMFLGNARAMLAILLKWINAGLLLGAVVALCVKFVSTDPFPASPFAMLALVFLLYSAVRLAALSYVAVYMGGFDARMMFSLYGAGVFLALPVIWWAVASERDQPK